MLINKGNFPLLINKINAGWLPPVVSMSTKVQVEKIILDTDTSFK